MDESPADDTAGDASSTLTSVGLRESSNSDGSSTPALSAPDTNKSVGSNEAGGGGTSADADKSLSDNSPDGGDTSIAGIDGVGCNTIEGVESSTAVGEPKESSPSAPDDVKESAGPVEAGGGGASADADKSPSDNSPEGEEDTSIAGTDGVGGNTIGGVESFTAVGESEDSSPSAPDDATGSDEAGGGGASADNSPEAGDASIAETNGTIGVESFSAVGESV